MTKKTIMAMSLGATLGVFSVGAADVTGKITLKGVPPPEKTLPLDPSCGKLHPTTQPKTRFYAVGSNGGLADVFVTIEGLTGKSTGATAQPAVLDQRGCEYLPYVMAVQTGQKITVKNSDPVFHNVHPTPKEGTRNKEENKAQLPKGPDLTFVFEDAEEFLRFKCDVHQWMYAYISVVDHPYFSVSGEDGTFKVSNLPPGKYTLKAMHRKAGTATKEIEVKDAPVAVNFEFDVK
jgi:plastocyanin